MGIEATTDAGDPVYFVSTEEVDAATVRAFDAELEAAVEFLRSMRRGRARRRRPWSSTSVRSGSSTRGACSRC